MNTSDRGLQGVWRKHLARAFQCCVFDLHVGIDYAHSRGVIHRDIKPANIILGKHGETLVVDWGLAKAVGRADPSVGEQTLAPSSSSGWSETLPGSALGTPAYMSPEQARGDLDRLGPRSDVYSLGATLYCLLTGKPPFEDDDMARSSARQAGAFERPSQLDPSIDRPLEAICLKAMALRAEGPLRDAEGLGRRPGAVDGRRAGVGLARAASRGGCGGRARGLHSVWRSAFRPHVLMLRCIGFCPRRGLGRHGTGSSQDRIKCDGVRIELLDGGNHTNGHGGYAWRRV